MQYRIIILAEIANLSDPRARREQLSAAGERLARDMLSRTTGRPPQTLQLVRDASGKPQLADKSAHFNISHSGDRVLCAVHTSPIGTDIERPGPYRDRVARRVCSPAEYAYINGDPVRFLEVWTRKEAYAKYTGRGLAQGLRDVPVADRDRLRPDIFGAKVYTANEKGYVFSIVY